MARARALLEEEKDIVKIIRSRRYLHMAIKHLLDAPLRKELKQLSHFREVDKVK